MDNSGKIVSTDALAAGLETARRAGKRIAFTNGCFDILHVGHVRYLGAAGSEGDLLVVGLNSDSSVRSIKGDRRPLVNQDQRAEVLASLACVDYVVVFDEPDPLRLIRSVKPDILVKGADWAEEDIVGGEFVKSTGGRIIRVELVSDASTTGIIERILERYC
jgi:D-beta-D-heptose 7-phosphate kinase/D-beta-D-heptose 1-phosphate adenosyltransferase